jgi:hypothetical protein
MNEISLTNDGVVLRLAHAPECDALAQRLTGFLAPYFSAGGGDATPDLTIGLHPAAQFGATERARCVEPFQLRKSTAAMFNLDVKLGTDGDGNTLAWDEGRQVGYRIDPDAATVRFYSGDEGFIHLIELVRYYGLLVEQARGSIVLHSAAVVDPENGQVAAIVGPKGAGKTTTMLALIATGRYRYFSGDKVLLDMYEGALRARGWPDFPHIGIGTLRQHPDLAARLDIALTADDGTPLSDRHKVLIDPALLMCNIATGERGDGMLVALILPGVDRDGDGELVELNVPQKEAVSDDDLFEWPHEFQTARWHGMQPPGLEESKAVPTPIRVALRAMPWHYLFGKPQPALAG